MGSSYRQFCPVAKAMELLDERWTLLVLRELMMGSTHFNDLRRGLPRMSPTLLSKRLHQLTAAGITYRDNTDGVVTYRLTDAGRELRPVVEALGIWGTRWIGELGDQDLDPKLLLWDMHRRVDHSAVPDGKTVVHFVFSEIDRQSRNWWLVINSDEVDVCDLDPGFEVTVSVSAGLRPLTEIWRGDLTWSDAIRSGEVTISGPEALRRSLPSWFELSTFASVPRPA
ncbi:transcriptional regulator [Rhodococcus sp. AD45-ID]|uniref:winged helix-turn-helix transcriptional regulator n=1 Tax=Rhodococcus TaxID=1827 RepID=UPI0005D2D48E|nr:MULTISPECIES: helix-turn-helix domain-containing protein [Rhodococcus]NRI69447.1 helix-turn-helix transcriptional regulator [Rhodococcus sp. MS16]KJF20297.1 putative HTH-type transcriptional regulator yybR [Rhodococcus sp. AD45]MCE4263274.1 helix-turn-helix transcriptional regulator [Rhodococcus globerulus]MDV8066040.1 helix-turn-helix domain-containing protein [Rhodococcus sp. IEGM 1366]PSR41370.1 transcriptional regulator [Rhodococcus sp. AD45-ID]